MLGLQTTTLDVKKAVFTSPDRHGNRQLTYADPVKVPIYGIAPATQTEPGGDGRRYAVATTWEVYAPLTTEIRAHDIVLLPDGAEAHIIGEVEYWKQTMFATNLGVEGIRFTVERRTG